MTSPAKATATMATAQTVLAIMATAQMDIVTAAKVTATRDSTAAMTAVSTRSTIDLDVSGAELAETTRTIDMATAMATGLLFGTPELINMGTAMVVGLHSGTLTRASLELRTRPRTQIKLRETKDRWIDHPWAITPCLEPRELQLQ